MTNELDKAVIVDFPLRGERWVAVNTPGERIPSHGTDMLGQRFAFDLLKVDARGPGLRYHPAGILRGFFIGVRTRDCFAWGAEIHAPFDREIVAAADGVPERSWIHPLRELIVAFKNTVTFSPARLRTLLGNYVIMRRGDVFAAFAHLAPGSVAVAPGQAVRNGGVLGRVGHTGNSTAPHLHFQLMDSIDPVHARGVPCAFRTYEIMRNGSWERVENGIPRKVDRIRYVGVDA
jgi:murein DD-endopeptidase MepM/ murein hydrolase activator NlpD